MYHQDLPRPSRTFQVSPGQSVNMESRRPEQQLHFRLKRTKREWRPLEERSCTDLPWFLLFIIFCVGMGSVCAFTVVSGGAARLVLGYDSYGNTCGRRNRHLDGVRLSGLDHTDRKFVFFLDPCNIDIVQRKMKSVALCVSLCPPHTLHTYHDLKTFAVLNGSELCSYELAGHKYPSLPERFSKCPKLPVPPSKPLPLFNRCTPVDISCYSKFAEAVVTFVSDDSFLHRVIAGVAASKEVIVGLCLLALVLSMALTVIIRYISAVLVWILTSLAVLGSLAGTGILWWFYVDRRLHRNHTDAEEDEPSRDGERTLLVYAVAASVFTVILLLLMLFMRKRVALAIALFHVAGKVFIHLPLLTLQPFITFLVLLLFWIYWILVLLFLGTSGEAVRNEEAGLTEFRLTGRLEYLTWFHAVGLLWITEFILACQQMTVAGAVVTYYFTRDKKRLPAWPIARAALRLLRYHVGTVAKGSFIITLVKMPRLLLIYVHKQLKGKENACARCVLKSCICCLWCLEKCLNYLNQHGLLHVRARRLRPAGGERPACGYRQRHRRFRALPREDSDRDHDGFRRRSAAQRAARLRRVAAAAGHRLSVRLLGGTLFPVRLRDGGGRALPLLRHRHQVQRRHAGKGVLHGQSSHGAGRAQPAFGAGGRPGADPRQGSAVGGGGDETHGSRDKFSLTKTSQWDLLKEKNIYFLATCNLFTVFSLQENNILITIRRCNKHFIWKHCSFWLGLIFCLVLIFLINMTHVHFKDLFCCFGQDAF
ncbi:choline transporter-like protein 1 isoform X3 [Phyllopteryx taeniolatus]|uniref:choline transporter-like protein 1 isoform X3 n=1 Tax=Phyllopteryx taeniolatus TaxID=161469 RepID=UPI002AD31F6D|nr:choline transporter-like protein 1 isoform X3 [Phyllopteryx taeniolatus]